MQKFAPILGLALFHSFASSTVLAQQSGENFIGLEEIIVTANKRAQNLQDVAMSVSAFNSDFFKDTGETDFYALEQYTPSLKIQAGADSRSTSIRIRGIGSTGANVGIDPSVGVFIDGVYQGTAGMNISDLVDIERVEVLRGPQGSLYGKNTAAGAISVVTARPASEYSANAEFTYNSDNQKELRGMINIPLGDNGNAARISGFAINGDHLYTNTFNGEGLNDANKWGLKSRVLFNFDDSELLVNFDYSRENTDCCVLAVIDYDGYSPAVIATPITDTNYAGLTPGVDYVSLEDTMGLDVPNANPFGDDYWISEQPSNDVEVAGASTEWTFDLANENTITFINAARTYTSVSSYDGDFTGAEAATPASTNIEMDQFSSEIRVASPGGETWDTQGGLYAFYSKSKSVGTIGIGRTILENSPQPLGFLLGQQSINVDSNVHETTSFAAFGQVVWNPTDQLSTTFGLRVTQEKKTRTGSQRTLRTAFELGHPYNLTNQTELPPWGWGAPLFPSDLAPIAGPDVDFDQSRTDTNVSPSLNVRYFWNDDFMTYASASKGFKSGGFDQRRVPVVTMGAINGGNDKAGEFNEEKATSFELGWKSTLMDNRLTFNGTFYLVDYKDFQAQAFDGSGTKVTNAGSLRSTGLELDTMFAATADLTIGSALGYNKAEYKDFINGQCTAEAVFLNGPYSICVDDLSGRTLDNAPELTVSTYAQYEKSLDSDLVVVARIEHNYTDSYYLDQDLDENLRNDAIDLINLRLTITNENRDWEAALWGKNILDEQYYQMSIDIPTVGGYAGVAAQGATYGLTLRRNFE